MSNNPFIPEIKNGVRVYSDGKLVFQHDHDTCAGLHPVGWGLIPVVMGLRRTLQYALSKL